MNARIGERGRVTIPAEIRRQAELHKGDAIDIEVVPEGILIRQLERDPDQAWFWTPEWQAKEREADEAIAAGQTTLYLSDEEFLAALESRMSRT